MACSVVCLYCLRSSRPTHSNFLCLLSDACFILHDIEAVVLVYELSVGHIQSALRNGAFSTSITLEPGIFNQHHSGVGHFQPASFWNGALSTRITLEPGVFNQHHSGVGRFQTASLGSGAFSTNITLDISLYNIASSISV